MTNLQEHLLDRRLTMDEVLGWSTSIATEVAAIHEQGHAHGGVAPENVRVEGNVARLTPPVFGADPNGQPQDIVRFAALLRAMLNGVDPASDMARAQWSALDRIAKTNSYAATGSRMKRVVLALKLLRSGCKVEAPPPVEAEFAGEVEATHPARRILMLVREVPPAVVPLPKQISATTIHVVAFLVSAATLAVSGCLLFLKYMR